jgi:hypothetical protein
VVVVETGGRDVVRSGTEVVVEREADDEVVVERVLVTPDVVVALVVEVDDVVDCDAVVKVVAKLVVVEAMVE